MKILKILCLILFCASCNSTRAVYDYDEQANFPSYKSIGIYPELRSGLSQLDEDRLLKSVEKILSERELFASSSPDLYLNIYTEQYQEQSRNTLGVGVGGTGRNVGVGVSGGIPLGGPETFLRLTFDLIDVSTDALVWQAVVDSKFNFNASPEERQNRFDKIVKEALNAYPPKR
ncbi:DUF4136 domain-containing protein [Salinimicrobium oceani]|uniref:DUF4136 domain-containing protein n=1 Tax=Salinimicrobium oceani TaxID=2722702 RepID=A0ABX1D086_9FLAO|nr:DUF4136 domain-containing protein [Salinimicrobium oceani]NJW53928.1 DUF4136 domain-containing protein [Salinimicrobium oceani]